jgi:hypothetical protein
MAFDSKPTKSKKELKKEALAFPSLEDDFEDSKTNFHQQEIQKPSSDKKDMSNIFGSSQSQ